MPPIDPSDVDVSLEVIYQLLADFKDDASGVFVKDDEKKTYSAEPIYHMIIAGRIPKCHELSIDETGSKTTSNLTPDDLTASSESWRKDFNLPSFGEILPNSSLFGANLESDDQAEAHKQAFLDFPKAALQMAISELFKKCKEKFTVENFPAPHEEADNPFKKMMQMQYVIVAIQTRIVLSVDVVENLWKRTCKERPQNLNQLRTMEVALATQAKLYELGKYEAPGSRDDEIATKLCKCQVSIEGSRFDGATQSTVTCKVGLPAVS
jgi:hypothetical protein